MGYGFKFVEEIIKFDDGDMIGEDVEKVFVDCLCDEFGCD